MEDTYRLVGKKPKMSRQSKVTEPRNSQKFVFKKRENILVKRLSPRAKIPTKKSDGAAGFDLTSPTPVYIPPLSSRSMGTKIAVQIPKGYCGKIEGRSGLAKSNQLAILGGLIDSDYRGEIEVLLTNLGPYPLDLPENSRIAQLVIQEIHEGQEMEEVEELEETDRDEGGFGSTGLTS